MKNIRSIISVLLIAISATACVKEKVVTSEYLDVNVNNISGSWELVEWNGSPLQSGTYVFMNLVRKDRTYTLWQNLDSFQDVPHEVTGRFFLETDPEYGAIIRGDYDHDSGDWAHRYIIMELTKDSMTWVAKDDASYVQKYKRIESVPVE